MTTQESAAKAISDMQAEMATKVLKSVNEFNNNYSAFNEMLKVKGVLWLMVNSSKIKAFADLDNLRFAAQKYQRVVDYNLNSRREKALEYLLELHWQRSNLEICFGEEKTKQIFDLLGFSTIKGEL
jgi:hypothetical protein